MLTPLRVSLFALAKERARGLPYPWSEGLMVMKWIMSGAVWKKKVKMYAGDFVGRFELAVAAAIQ